MSSLELKDLKPMHLYKFADKALSENYSPFLFVGIYPLYQDLMLNYEAFEVLTKEGIDLYNQPKSLKYIEIE